MNVSTTRILYPALFVCALLSTLPANAASYWHTSAIGSIYPQADGSYVLRFKTDHASCTDTNSPKYFYVTVGVNGMTAAGADRIYAAAMLAMATGKLLTFAFESNGCFINRASVED